MEPAASMSHLRGAGAPGQIKRMGDWVRCGGGPCARRPAGIRTRIAPSGVTSSCVDSAATWSGAAPAQSRAGVRRAGETPQQETCPWVASGAADFESWQSSRGREDGSPFAKHSTGQRIVAKSANTATSARIALLRCFRTDGMASTRGWLRQSRHSHRAHDWRASRPAERHDAPRRFFLRSASVRVRATRSRSVRVLPFASSLEAHFVRP